MNTKTEKAPSTKARRLRRTAIVVGLASAAVVAAPAAAFANYGWGGTISPGGTACVGQQANYQVRGAGSSNGIIKYTLYKDGVLVQSSTGTTNYTVERRTSYGNFPGAGFYTFCAKNNQSSGILTNIRILADQDF